MADRAAIIQELARRGKLPPKFQPLYDEAVRRGLVGGNEPEIEHRGSILPIDRDTEGGLHLNWDSGLTGAAKRAFSLPGDIYSERVPAMVPDTGEGVTNPEVVARASELAGFMVPVTPARGTGRAIAEAGGWPAYGPRKPTSVPTREELRGAGAEGFERARDMGVDYDPNAVANLASVSRAELENAGFVPRGAPITFEILQTLESPPADSIVQLSGLIAARRALQKIPAGPDHNVDREAARRVIEALDGFSQEPPAGSVMAGPAAEAGRVLEDARGNYAASKRSERLNTAEEAADLNANVANSGQNIDNALRRQAANIVDPRYPHRRRGFSQEEVAALEEVANGTGTRNTLRYVGNLLGGGGGLGTYLMTAGGGAGGAAAFMSGHPFLGATSLALPAIGIASKKGANALTRRAFESADEAVRMRSPLYGTRAAQAGPQVRQMSPAMLRALMLAGPNELGGPRGGGGH